MPPPLPANVKSWPVTKGDGSKTRVVTIVGASRLMGIRQRTIKLWIDGGKLETCLGQRDQTLVLVDSLWAQVPEEFHRA